jgi:hypothetical protein
MKKTRQALINKGLTGFLLSSLALRYDGFLPFLTYLTMEKTMEKSFALISSRYH